MKWILRRAKRLYGDEGYMMVLVLVTLTIFSVLGAVLLLLFGFLFTAARGISPSFKAFCIADAALGVACDRIMKGVIPPDQEVVINGSLFGGEYEVRVRKKPGSSMEYAVTSWGIFHDGGKVYRRGIYEEVLYAGEQAYDVLKNYLMYAGKKLKIDFTNVGSLFANVDVYGNIGGAEGVEIGYKCGLVFPNADSFGIHGNVDSYSDVVVNYNVNVLLADPKMVINGNVRTGNDELLKTGKVRLIASGIGIPRPRLEVSTGTGQAIYTMSPPDMEEKGWANIVIGPVVNQRMAPRVYIPRPNYSYYKALAMEQGNVLTSNTLSGELLSSSRSSETVLYYPGNGTLYIRGALWNQPNARGVIVSEGDIRVSQSLALFEGAELKLIAKGSIIFDDQLELSIEPSNKFFMWAGGNIVYDISFFKGVRAQITALGDIVVRDRGFFADWSNINYLAPDVDVYGFQPELKVLLYKEITS